MKSMPKGSIPFRSTLLPFIFVIGVTAASTATYFLSAPKGAVRGGNLRAVLNTYQYVPRVFFSVKDVNAKIVHSTLHVPDSSGVADISIPVNQDWLPGTYELRAEASNRLFNASTSFDVAAKSHSIFVQTDKAIYKPAQTVNFRVLVTTAELKPLDTLITVEVKDPANHKIAQWIDQTTTLGVASFSLPLSDRPPLGDWAVRVVAGDQYTEKVFTVAEYALPRFSVTVELPRYLTVGQTQIHGSVSAMYTYGESVQGTATVIFELGSNQLSKTFAINGKQSFELGPADLGKLGLADPGSDSFVATANVTEALSGITLSGNSSTNVNRYDAVVTFLPASNDYFKKGFEYIAYIKVAHPDGSLLGETNLQLSLVAYYTTFDYAAEEGKKDFYTYTENVHTIENKSVPIPDHGIVIANVAIPEHSKEYVNLKAILLYKGQEISQEKYITTFLVNGSNDISVQLVGSSDSFKSGDKVTLAVTRLKPTDAYYYIATARGQIVSFATLDGTSSTFDVLLTPRYAPQTTFVVYIRGAENEIVADSVAVNVAGAFRNKVELSFKSNNGLDLSQALPGENVTLQVRSEPSSLIGLLSVDESVLLLKGGNDLTETQLLEEMSSYASSSQLDGPGLALVDFFWPKRGGGGGGTSSRDIFAKAGLNIDTDAYIEQGYPEYYFDRADFNGRPEIVLSDTAPKTKIQTGSEVRTRSFFPETWIWSLLTLNSSGVGSLVQKTPDTITSWITTAFSMNDQSGLAVTPTASRFKVFQNFFVSAILPYSVVRGEEVAVKVVVFNYMDAMQTVTVTLLESSGFSARLDGTNGSSFGQNLSTVVSVPAGSGSNARFWIVPHVLGNVKIVLAAFSPYGGDRVENDLLVKPEGVEQSYCLSDFVILKARGDYNRTFELQYPASVVPGSRRVEVGISGDIMGPSIGGLEQLVQVPYGCGEQNMITFTPNIFVREYLEAIGQLDPVIQSKTLMNMLLGYQRELTYWRKDGFFSAFGDSDTDGSTWLTAFVVKSFRQAQRYLASSIDENVLRVAKNKILQERYSANGTFIERGRVIHVDMQGGSSSGLALTAYVLIALLEDNPAIGDVLNSTTSTVSLLENSFSSLGSDVYTLAIVTYALQLAGSSSASQSLTLLEQHAVIAEDTIHWAKASTSVATAPPCYYCPQPSGASAIEMTSYGLLTYVRRGDLIKASHVAKWLSNQRSSFGGCSSTQDTVLALQSLAGYSKLVRPSDFSLAVALQTDNSDRLPNVIIDSRNSLLQQTLVIQHPDTLNKVGFTAAGQGSAIVRVCVFFNVLSAQAQPLVETRITVTPATPTSPFTFLKTCARSTISGGASGGMGIVQVNLASGFTVSHGDVQGGDLRRIDYGDSSVALYYDQFNSSWICSLLRMEQAFPVTAVKDAYVKAFHYYNPSQHRTTAYNPLSGFVERATSSAASSESTTRKPCRRGQQKAVLP